MKKEKLSVMLSFISMIIFLISAIICYVKINSRIDNIKQAPSGVTIFTFDSQQTAMNIDPNDMLFAQDRPVASSEAILNAKVESEGNQKVSFNIIFNNNTGYNMSDGVNDINEKEYTYEILKNDESFVPETQFDSYLKNSKIILAKDTIDNKEGYKYKIIFRFYANNCNQDHLLGTQLNSILSVEQVQ